MMCICTTHYTYKDNFPRSPPPLSFAFLSFLNLKSLLVLCLHENFQSIQRGSSSPRDSTSHSSSYELFPPHPSFLLFLRKLIRNSEALPNVKDLSKQGKNNKGSSTLFRYTIRGNMLESKVMGKYSKGTHLQISLYWIQTLLIFWFVILLELKMNPESEYAGDHYSA